MNLKKQTYQGAIIKYKDSKYRHEKKSLTNDFMLQEIDNANYETLKDYLGDDLFERIEYELGVIHDKGYDDYFLVVSDLMKWSASQGILMGVRGSVAGSVVAHCLEIVEVEPLKWELYFERFLNPERPSPPDIDMDIQDTRRDEVIAYAQEKYGEDAVSAIIAIGRLKTKAAIRDVARVMGIDLVLADKLSKMVHVLFGKVYPIDKMMETDEEFSSIINGNPKLQELANYVRKIENMGRHSSVHACGHLITPGPIINYVPLQKERGGEGRTVTQFEGPYIEELGLMKFDFLGLRTLGIIDYALKLINGKDGNNVDFYNIPSDDKKTFDIFSKGETIGVFQFESPPMQQYLKELRPETQEDICFMVAAYRPGAMKYIPDYIKIKHGLKKAEYPIPELKHIVDVTNGYMIYQEQLMRVAVDLAGYNMGAADSLRKAVGKKKLDVMKKEEPKFKEGIVKNGFSQAVADKLWEMLLPFADYGFNKAHAAGYAVLAYKCAYLKAHFPLEFMTALMHADLENLDRVTIDIQEAKRMGYKVLPPNINTSKVYFSPENEDSIRFGLGAIKNVGIKVCQTTIKEREENGVYTSMDDLVVRVGTDIINKRSLESLIRSGALDEFGDRNALLTVMPEVLQKANIKSKAVDENQTDLFSLLGGDEEPVVRKVNATTLPEVDPVRENEKIKWEKELLGIFISSHPLQRFGWTRIFPEFVKLNTIDELEHNKNIKVLCTISNVRYTFTKKDNQRMAILTLEDDTSKADAVVFPRTFEKIQHLLLETTPLIIRGTINIRDDRKSIIVNEVEHGNTLHQPRKLNIDIRGVTDESELQNLKKCFENGGDTEIVVRYGIEGNNEKMIMRRADLSKDEVLDCLKKWISINY